ncbi:MAG TPA: hypothetical protein PLU88_05350, partial [Armatimonadota bacterium]|nr:hypothetical protein [Armatimonadota bacterium]
MPTNATGILTPNTSAIDTLREAAVQALSPAKAISAPPYMELAANPVVNQVYIPIVPNAASEAPDVFLETAEKYTPIEENKNAHAISIRYVTRISSGEILPNMRQMPDSGSEHASNIRMNSIAEVIFPATMFLAESAVKESIS